MDNPELARSLRLQAAGCRNLGSPFHGDLLEHAADDLEADGPVVALLTPWAEADLRKLFDDAVALRLLGGLHDLVLSGDDLALAATYPTPGRKADAARQEWAGTMRRTSPMRRLAIHPGGPVSTPCS